MNIIGIVTSEPALLVPASSQREEEGSHGKAGRTKEKTPLSSSLTHHDTQCSASPPTVGTTLHSEITGETKVKSFR